MSRANSAKVDLVADGHHPGSTSRQQDRFAGPVQSPLIPHLLVLARAVSITSPLTPVCGREWLASSALEKHRDCLRYAIRMLGQSVLLALHKGVATG